jgi:hypothetical protein
MQEVADFLKAPIHTRVSNICDLVDASQLFHHALTDGHRRNLGIVLLRDRLHDPIREFLDRFRADRTLLAGFLDAGKSFSRKLFRSPSA